ncbi:MAG: energy transducer TonB [Owenweeksia sp.]
MLPLAIAMTLHACNKGTDKSDQASAVTKAYEFTEVEQPPLFAGCSTSANSDDQKACFNQGIIKHIQENLEYPEQAKELGISGKVYIEFVVNEKGNVSDVKMLRGITLEENANAELKQAAKSLEDRAIHLVSDIPGLTPARLKGKKVAMKFVLPINFRVK